MAKSFAYYRLPYADNYTLVESEQDPLLWSDMDQWQDETGFVIAPFRATAQAPVILIRADQVTERKVPDASAPETLVAASETPTNETPAYAKAFTAFHSAIVRGEFHKLVLARQAVLPLSGTLADRESVQRLFELTCTRYPRLMIMLFSTPPSGMWLVASPEILIDGHQGSYHTVALAGTMPFREGLLDWSGKNREEQHIVEQYIEQILASVGKNVLKDGPVSSRAGNLVHLRTDFRFHLPQGVSVGSIVRRLHPTPAVCGLPKQEAIAFIRSNEDMDRSYYSGFAGPMGIGGETHLYVSLRCARLTATEATLFAGGGIMPGSDCRSEWQETEQKMKTIRHVLR